ncbi:MAG: amidohydrolase family protein [Firmicutes bacterium]|nr:amidohydrolase family protein [Bacillota bacterium]
MPREAEGENFPGGVKNVLGETYRAILEAVETIPVIDTHEHLYDYVYSDNRGQDILAEYLMHYLRSDLVSAGLGPEELAKAVDPGLPLIQRWKLVEPYWEASRYTGYGRALDIAVSDIYGIDGIRGETIEELGEVFRQQDRLEHARYVLKELCNIEVSLLDIGSGNCSVDPNLFRCAWQPEDYIMPFVDANGDALARVEANYGSEIRSLDDWMAAFVKELEARLTQGIVALKIALAYVRSLRFEQVSYGVARDSFASALAAWRRRDVQSGSVFPRELQDFMMHYVLSVSNEKQLVIQVHTGLLEGNGNILSNSDPTLLNDLFLLYPEVTFDLFHIGYPYQGITTALAKMFPNVFIDMCWSHIISPSAAVSALADFLDAVPYNKICGFGGDYLFVDGVYGHLYLARRNISQALAEKVEEGVFSIDTAIGIAEHLLYQNPRRVFRLEDV